MKELGVFGDPHTDSHDAVITWSTVTACPRLPSGYTAGEFHLLSLGFYIPLSRDAPQTFSFCGLELHSASAPRAPQGVEPCPTAVRFLSVAYAGDILFNGDGLFPFATLPHGGVIWVGPEERDAGYVPNMLDTAQAHSSCSGYHIKPCRSKNINFVDDARGLMDDASLTTFVIHNLLLQNLSVIESLPLSPQLDPRKFLAAFSIEEKGARKPFPEWPNAPHLARSQDGYAGTTTSTFNVQSR